MDCVTARCGSQVQPTKMTLARQRVLSSSEVRASDLEHGGSWVRIPSGAQIFSVSSYGSFFTSPFISFIRLNNVYQLETIIAKAKNEMSVHLQKWHKHSCPGCQRFFFSCCLRRSRDRKQQEKKTSGTKSKALLTGDTQWR